MRKFKIPENIKEIYINDMGYLVYLKKELIQINGEWKLVSSWEQLKEIKND